MITECAADLECYYQRVYWPIKTRYLPCWYLGSVITTCSRKSVHIIIMSLYKIAEMHTVDI